MGSPFKLNPGSRASGSGRDGGMRQMALRGLIGGGPKTHEDGHKDAMSGDELPSYNVKSADHTASGGGDSSESTTTSTYTPPTKTAKGDAAYAALTPAERKAQDDKYIKLNTKTVTTPASSSASTNINSENKTLGDLTSNQIDKNNEITNNNIISKKNANALHETNLRKIDSAAMAQKRIGLSETFNGPESLTPEKLKSIQYQSDNFAVEQAAKRRSIKRFNIPVSDEEKAVIKEQIKKNVSQTPRY